MDTLDNLTLYHYGCYVCLLAGINKGIAKKNILEMYEKLPIQRRDEIDITAKEMCEVLNKEPGSFIGKLYSKIEDEILKGNLLNDNKLIKNFVKENENG